MTDNMTTYRCDITDSDFSQKSHIVKHLKSKIYKTAVKKFREELEGMSKKDLKKIYKMSNIDDIIEALSCIKVKNTYELIKQKKDGTVYFELTDEQKQEKADEIAFKNEFKNKLKKWHNMLSGAGVTGDPALDDIINILVICYLENKISDTGKFDFKNLERYPKTKQKKINSYLECFNYDYIKTHTSELTKSKDCKSIFSKIGFILSNHPTTSGMFPNEDIINCNKDTILSKLITEIYKYSQEKNIFEYQDLIGIACEYMLNEYKGNAGKDLGNYFTERDLMLITFNLLDKDDVKKYINDNSTIGDEFCGTFGFPLYMKKFLQEKYKINIKDKNIYGVEIGDRQSRFAIINAMFAMNDFSNVKRGDGFTTNINKHLDLSIHNVPFGKRISYSNTKEHYNHIKTDEMPEFKDIIPVDVGKCDAPIASQMVIYKTKHIGLCIIKDGQETTGNGKFIKYRKYFCDSCNIKKILKIPGGIFSSTGTKTVCLYFVKGKKTKNIEFMELNDECNKITKLVKVSYNDLKHNDFSWDPNTYMIDEDFAKLMTKAKCEFKKLGDVCEFMPKSKRKADYGQDTGKYNFYTSSYKVKKCDEYDYENECIIIGDGGKANIKIDNKFSCSDHNIIIKSTLNKYIYYFLLNNMYLLENGFKGAGLKNISKEYLKNIQIPIPSKEKQESCVQQLDLLNKRKQRLEEDNEMINKQMKFYFENQIQKNLDDIEVKKLGDVCEIKRGERVIKSDSIKDGKYYVYGGGDSDENFKLNKFNRVGYNIKIGRYGGSPKNFIMELNNKFWLHDNGFTLEINDLILKKYIGSYLTLITKTNENYEKLYIGSPPALSISNFQNIQIPILQQEIQNEIVEYLDELENIKQSNNTQIEQLNELMKSILEQSYL
jgi:restriction endonuclease S subunit/type I restriction-modification system DNA methylase subunit